MLTVGRAKPRRRPRIAGAKRFEYIPVFALRHFEPPSRDASSDSDIAFDLIAQGLQEPAQGADGASRP